MVCSDFVKLKYILILTCGENFEDNYEGKGRNIRSNGEKEAEIFTKLIDECGNRILIFNKITKDGPI